MSTTEIIAVLHSAHFKKGLLEGYGILVTPEKIVGAKKFKMGFFTALLLDESKLDIATRMKAYEVAKEIEENKDFEVTQPTIRTRTEEARSSLSGPPKHHFDQWRTNGQDSRPDNRDRVSHTPNRTNPVRT